MSNSETEVRFPQPLHRMNLEYIDTLPQLPEHLLVEVLDSIRSPNLWIRPNSQFYSIHEANQILQDWIYQHFDRHFEIRIQKISEYLAPHIDLTRNFCYNYIVYSGGPEAETRFHDSDHNILERHVIQEKRWHRLNVSEIHSVANLKTDRISISVYERIDIKNGKN